MTKEEFKTIYHQYFDSIRNYLYYRSGNAELSTDIAQETFMKVWEKQFDNTGGTIKSLLYKIASDLFVSHIRKQKVQNEYVEEVKLRYNDQDHLEDTEEDTRKILYQKALGKLPENQRVVLLMNKMEGLTYKEIAASLDLSVKAIEKRMSLALKTLKKELNIS